MMITKRLKSQFSTAATVVKTRAISLASFILIYLTVKGQEWVCFLAFSTINLNDLRIKC